MAATPTPTTLSEVAPDLLLHVASYLSLPDVCAFICTNSALRKLVRPLLTDLDKTALPFLPSDFVGLDRDERAVEFRRLEKFGRCLACAPKLNRIKVGESWLLYQFIRMKCERGRQLDLSPFVQGGLRRMDDLLPSSYFLARWISKYGSSKLDTIRLRDGQYDKASFRMWPIAPLQLDFSTGAEGGYAAGPIRDEGAALIAMLLHFDYRKIGQRLSALTFNNAQLGDLGAQAIGIAIASGKAPCLRTLMLEDNDITFEGVDFLLLECGRALSTLTTLSLDGNPIGDVGAAILARAIKLGHATCLESLSLMTCTIGDAGGKRLGEALGAGDCGMPNIQRGGRCARLRELFLDQNTLGSETNRALIDAMRNDHLPELETLQMDPSREQKAIDDAMVYVENMRLSMEACRMEALQVQ